ncbi:hypothetical protein DM860_002744 [Cuscuta australis]|uniref:Uncharacterized protein n=1 Tax=Cuscuta australis TaxID=267555 RepID=A0A328D476_9ASTE|nr:hypothetical protein DM860_002744 [Cuscuta australis]
MAYRRRQGVTRSSTFKEDFRRSSPDDVDEASVSSPMLADRGSSSLSPLILSPPTAIDLRFPFGSILISYFHSYTRHIDSSLRSVSYVLQHSISSQGAPVYDYTSMKSVDEAGGFWGVLAWKAKAILEDDTTFRQWEDPSIITSNSNKSFQQYESPIKLKNPTLRKGLDALTSSLNHIGNALEIRVQLETLLAEKARLAHENAEYARENHFLREIVEYHQLTMQDVVY